MRPDKLMCTHILPGAVNQGDGIIGERGHRTIRAEMTTLDCCMMDRSAMDPRQSGIRKLN